MLANFRKFPFLSFFVINKQLGLSKPVKIMKLVALLAVDAFIVNNPTPFRPADFASHSLTAIGATREPSDTRPGSILTG